MTTKSKVGLVVIGIAVIFAIASTPLALGRRETAKTENRTCETADNDLVSSSKLIELINRYRESIGLRKLIISSDLTRAASHKGYLFKQTKEWDHSIKGRSFDAIMEDCLYRMPNLGENLARGFESVEWTLEAWKQSPTHKAIIEGSYEYIGVYVSQETDRYTVMEVAGR